MPSHVDPAIYVAANMGERAVTARAMNTLKLSQAAAVGHLVMFWGQAALNTPDGRVGHLMDVQLERWAGWTGKRGRFAAWLRAEHLDASGRPNEWDEYAGKLVASREKARDKKRQQRGQSSVCPGDSPRDKSGTVPETSRGLSTRAREEGEREGERELNTTLPDTLRADALPLVIAANQAIERRWGEQTQPLLPGHGASHRLAVDLLEAGVPVAFAQRSIVRQLEAKPDGPPRSMAYFKLGVLADWQAQQTRALGAAAPRVEALESIPRPRLARGETGFLASVIAEESAKRQAEEVARGVA